MIHQVNTASASDDKGVLVLLVRKDQVIQQLSDSEDSDIIALRADAFGSLRVVLPGETINSQRTAAVHDDELRRVMEDVLVELRKMNAWLGAN